MGREWQRDGEKERENRSRERSHFCQGNQIFTWQNEVCAITLVLCFQKAAASVQFVTHLMNQWIHQSKRSLLSCFSSRPPGTVIIYKNHQQRVYFNEILLTFWSARTKNQSRCREVIRTVGGQQQLTKTVAMLECWKLFTMWMFWGGFSRPRKSIS